MLGSGQLIRHGRQGVYQKKPVKRQNYVWRAITRAPVDEFQNGWHFWNPRKKIIDILWHKLVVWRFDVKISALKKGSVIVNGYLWYAPPLMLLIAKL